MPKRQAIIFDMDGLMVDSEPLARQAWDQVLQVYGYRMTDDVYRQMIGLRSDYAVDFVIQNYSIPLKKEEMLTQKAAIFHELRAQGVPALPGLMPLHDEIRKRKIPWAVATSSPREHANIILAQLGLSNACQAIAAGNEVSNSKPAPDIYLLAAKRLGVDPTVCLALEDSKPGCQAAAAAGMKVIAIPNGETKTAVFACASICYASLNEVVRDLGILLAD